MQRGLIAEYGEASALVRAVHTLRGRGYARLEAYTPFAVADLDRALGAPASRLPVIVAGAGVVGAIGAYGLQWFVDGFSERSGIQVELVAFPGIGRLPEELEMALYRVVQESLTNVHRHASTTEHPDQGHATSPARSRGLGHRGRSRPRPRRRRRR